MKKLYRLSSVSSVPWLRKLFDRLDAKKNVVIWIAMVSGYIKFNQIEEDGRLLILWDATALRIEDAQRLFNQMHERDVVS